MVYVSELKVVMARRGMNQRKVAHKARVSESTVNRWSQSPVEKGDIKSLLHICDALDCQPGDIIKRSEEE